MAEKIFHIQEMQTRFAELLALVEAGTEVILTNNNTPLARLVPAVATASKRRIAGLHPGAMTADESFDEALPDDFWLEGS